MIIDPKTHRPASDVHRYRGCTSVHHRAIMKSKLQIMTGHNSRSLPRALCLIVALFAPVRPDACLRARARETMGFNAHLNPQTVNIHGKPTDAICRGPLRATTPRDSRGKKRRIGPAGSFVRGMFFFLIERK